MNTVTTITTKGQVTIPEAVRQILQAKVGDKVSFGKLSPAYREAVIKIIPTDIVDELSGSLVTKVKITDHKKARSGVRKQLLKKYNIR